MQLHIVIWSTFSHRRVTPTRKDTKMHQNLSQIYKYHSNTLTKAISH